ncbi:hypothetical protein [Aquimarina sp. 2201CG14-23]|uniref:hypothetical protein n=1 Tax=Aquimarina mycalae TaxID=3040073 RepID=UPI002478039C|nr:hypothetical protein [Aquimarina sp. 2201CG14-23]MDH7446757.1 hypothetical protein [Aquimarina sp. 2201CG14-23]
MKHTSILLMLIMMSGYSFAQKPVLSEDFSFKIGEKYKRIKSLNSYYVASGDRLVAIKKGRSSMTIQRFSLEDLKEDVKKRQVIEDKGDFQTVMNLGGKAVVFYTVKDKAFAQKISLTGIIAEKPVLIGSDKENINNDVGFKSTYGFDAGGRINKFVFKKSFDGSKLLVLFRVKTADDTGDKIGISVYDTSLKLLWKRKVKLPYASKWLENEDFAIDNEGSFYLTASVFNSGAEEKNKLDFTYRTEVFKIKENPKDIIKSKISLSGKSVMDAIIGLDKGGKIRVSGFYSDNATKAEASGMFSAILDETGNVASVVKSDIPAETVQQYLLKREERVNEGTQKDDDKKDFENLKVNNIVFNEDGSIVLLGEQRYVESFTTSSSSGSRTTYKYFYRDVIASKLSSDGSVTWFHKLPKHQIGARGKRSMSYVNFTNSGKHYLFHIDDFTNLKRSFDEIPTRYFDGKKEFLYLTSYTINDATGEVIKEPILTGSDIRNSRLDHLELYKAATLPNQDMIFEAYDGKKNNLLLKVSGVK